MKLFRSFFALVMFAFIFHLTIMAYAQSAAEVPQASSVSQAVGNPEPSSGEKAVAVLKDVDSKIPLEIPAWLLGSLVFVAELGTRIYPSAKPKSLLLLVASVFGLLGSIFSKLSGLADNIVQNVKEPNPPGQ